MYHDLTKGSISRSLLLFALSMIAGNMLQQLYNIADTLIVGRVLGRNALAAVGSAYALLTFLTSIFLGLSMGAGALFSIYKAKRRKRGIKGVRVSWICSDHVSDRHLKHSGLSVFGSYFTFPEGASRSLGWHEGISADYFCRNSCNISLQLFCLPAQGAGKFGCPTLVFGGVCPCKCGTCPFVCGSLEMGHKGAAFATILAQFLSGIGITCYVFFKCKELLPDRRCRDL